jgi:coproporphyrinogen III oxidase-like Fe-S oxidoreductase
MCYPKKKIPIYVSYEEITEREAAKEYFLLNMRLYQGIELADFVREFGEKTARMYLDRLEPYAADGFVSIKNGIYKFTEKGMFVSNYIKNKIVSEVEDILDGEKTADTESVSAPESFTADENEPPSFF